MDVRFPPDCVSDSGPLPRDTRLGRRDRLEEHILEEGGNVAELRPLSKQVLGPGRYPQVDGDR